MLELLLVLTLISAAIILAQLRQRSPRRRRVVAAAGAGPSLARISHFRPRQPLDKAFVQKTARGGIYGLLLGTLGIERGHSFQVRAFAEYMVQDNIRINSKLSRLAESRGIDTAKTLDPAQRAIIQQLSRLSGPDFDCQFLKTAILEHKGMVEAFRQEIESGGDQDLRRFACDILPDLERHIKSGKKARASLPGLHNGIRRLE